MNQICRYYLLSKFYATYMVCNVTLHIPWNQLKSPILPVVYFLLMTTMGYYNYTQYNTTLHIH